ncbi:NAD(P)H-dependent flavin oxidoreductase [Larkinella bovis]|uniref:Propionate 3-nitronate monooxygenase n=1 Tax=Larkinella bovis TaxID=683041 RepID=A0ABW0IJA0_9BACT
MKRQNTLTDLLGIHYPLIQAPMLGITTPAMVAAVSNQGGLGSLPVGGLSPEQTRTLLRETKAKTGKPFAVNLFAHSIPERIDEDQLTAMQDFLEKFCREHDLPFTRRAASAFQFHDYRDQVDILLDEQIRVVSFTFGVLEQSVVDQLSQSGTVLVGTATSLEEALVLAGRGVHAVVAQGIEAGGHRGTFLDSSRLPQVGLFSLLPQLVEHLEQPVIAAGGIYDRKTVQAVFTLGASAAQIGSLFLVADESAAVEAQKKAVLASKSTDTVLTNAFTGRWARGIRNRFMEALEASGLALPDYTVQNSLTAPIRAYAQATNRADFLSMWAGQSASKSVRGSTAAIFNALVSSLDFDA